MSERPDSEAGFTLIELMIVVVVVGILAMLAIPRFTGVSQGARQAEAGPILRQICTLAEAQREQTGTWPADLAAITTFVQPNAQYFNFGFNDGTATATAIPGQGVEDQQLGC
jgi:prepilin-type N-terminal cleavage/methylation domain-containing protein